ncbi:MAG TPA: DUF4845 domain-containing protein [Rhodoferax sp.]|nr:DUF4845 domain-containing protein [Rhodoferax sp.]
MERPLKSRQRGLSFIGLIFFGGILAVIGVMLAQVAPTVIEYESIVKAANKAASQGTSVAEVREIFDKQADIDYITSVAGKDLDVTKNNDNKVVVSFAYDKEIHMVGPAYLLLKYRGQSQ